MLWYLASRRGSKTLRSFFSKFPLKHITTIPLLIAVILGSSFGINNSSAAVYGFTQSSWTGGQTNNTATHTSNQTNWTQYSAKDTNLTAGSTLALNNATQSTHIDYNTESHYIQQSAANGTDFVSGEVRLHAGGIAASGGTITYTDSNGLNPRTSPAYVGGYTVHTFTSSGTFTPSGAGNVSALVVAGGGGTGTVIRESGGGGGGGVIYNATVPVSVQSYNVIVGAGGSGANGGNSSFSTVTATGGGAGLYPAGAQNGGSGGGGMGYVSYNGGGLGISGQGNNGGYGLMNEGTGGRGGGGGGGAGGAGGVPSVSSNAYGGNGGPGISNSISGVAKYYGGGGGGGAWDYDGIGYGGSGGIGGGGHGAGIGERSVVGGGTNGTPNTGGGAGGGGNFSGGSGIVIVRYSSASSYPTTPYYVTTNASSQKNTSTWGAIQSITTTQTTPTNTNIKYLVSFDNRATWKYWNGSSWQTSTLANITTNGMTKATIEAITSTQWNTTNGFTPGTFDIAASLSTTSTTVTPELDNIQINYTTPQTQTLTSNIYNTETSTTQLTTLQWSETLPANTDIKFRIRTSPDGSNWTDWCGPDNSTPGTCSTTTYFTNNTGSETIDDIHTDRTNDQYIQYRAYLSTTDGQNTPTLSSITLNYDTTTYPSVTTQNASNITATSATLNATITATGDNNPERIIEYGTTSGSYTQSCTQGTGGTGSYACNILTLQPNTTYYARAKATNSIGTTYGSEISFTTSIGDPAVTTNTPSNITTNSAQGNATVTDTGNDNPERFIEWGTTSGNYTQQCSAGTGSTGAYSCTMTGLNPNTTYYTRAKVTNGASTQYGNETTFTTLTDDPTTTTQPPTVITTNSAAGNGTITDTGGEDPERFIQWGTQSSTYTDFCSAGTGGTGTYTCSMTNLTPNTTYYVRAYATNSAGTAYGNELSFTTNVDLPTATTQDASNITTNSATGNGTVTYTGNENPTREIEWGTQSNTYTHSCTAGTGPTGTYSCTMTGLSPNTTYYTRAKVTNTGGTNYGSEVSFTTAIADPAVTTNTPSNITTNSAQGNATVTETGNDNPERFIEWGTTSGNYTQQCFAGTGSTGAYSCTMTGLSPNITYYTRAKVTNGASTQYGNETTFTTLTNNPQTTTELPTVITTISAQGNGTITDTGGEDPERFIQWGTQSSTYTHNCSAGTGATGAYSCTMTGLFPNTTYYVRAYATNAAGTAYGDELSFNTQTLTDLTIIDPNTPQIDDAVQEGYMSITDGTQTNAQEVRANVNVTLQSGSTEATLPTNTYITETNNGSMNFQNFTLEPVSVKDQQPTSRTAFRLGIEGTNLTFSQPITITTTIGDAFNDQILDILYQQEGESTWNTHGTCTITNGQCTFQTDHATIYTINGIHQSEGDTPLNLNVEVQSTLSMDCYDTSGGTGDHDVSLGTTTNPGTLTAGTPAIGQSTCNVTTNDTEGYYLTLEDDNGAATTTLTHTDPNTGSVYEISDLTHWDQGTMTTENWSAPTTKGLGFSIISFPDTNLTNNTFSGIWTNTNQCPEGTNPDTNDYAGIPNTPQTIAAVTQYEPNTTTTNICYKVDVPPSQPSGIYQGSVTYTATSDASSYLN